jgi:hypothetical protein
MNCAIHTDTQAAAFCRTCGKALCDNCKRDVMGAIYCEPCIAARLQSGAPGAAAAIPVVPVSGTPSPAVAAMLGFIPGVGAMYNGQFVKAFIHLVIFACLIALYMVFEAHHTARAKQFGLPSPDYLGLEHLFGIQENEPPAGRTAANVQAATEQAAVHPVIRDRAPTGAIVLVALGVFFLLGNLGMVHVHRLWPLLLIGLGLWITFKRTTGRG